MVWSHHSWQVLENNLKWRNIPGSNQTPPFLEYTHCYAMDSTLIQTSAVETIRHPSADIMQWVSNWPAAGLSVLTIYLLQVGQAALKYVVLYNLMLHSTHVCHYFLNGSFNSLLLKLIHLRGFHRNLLIFSTVSTLKLTTLIFHFTKIHFSYVNL